MLIIKGAAGGLPIEKRPKNESAQYTFKLNYHSIFRLLLIGCRGGDKWLVDRRNLQFTVTDRPSFKRVEWLKEIAHLPKRVLIRCCTMI